MSAIDKLHRFINPQTIEDYGLRFSGDELRAFPEGREIIAAMFPDGDPVMDELGNNAGSSIASLLERLNW